ncbi:hypothetical protein [Streptomyces sp. NPDC052292]|uniref:hypothetical protein n=1 Tax=Streptomyces sp. NPDC052292 TaxID=3155053 RepID=UPI003416496D
MRSPPTLGTTTYDLGGRRCVRDLLPSRVRRHGGGDVEIRFRHNRFAHDEDLLVRCTGVSGSSPTSSAAATPPPSAR